MERGIEDLAVPKERSGCVRPRRDQVSSYHGACVPYKLLMWAFRVHSRYQKETKNNVPDDQPIYSVFQHLLPSITSALPCSELS